MFHNIRTIHKHSLDLAHDPNIQAATVLCVAETHMQATTSLKVLKETFPHAYHNSQKEKNDQRTSRHGTSIFSKHKLENIKHFNTNTPEASTAYDRTNEVHIACVYRYPTSSIPNFIEDIKTIPDIQTNNRKIVIGDFNINILNKNQQTLKKICKDLNTKQIITTETTKQNTIIDHMYTHKHYNSPSLRSNKNILF